MKIIHTADLHLDSKMETYLTKEKAKERKLEVRFAFQRLVEYASENNVQVIIISGDMFDTKNIISSTKNFVLNLIGKYSNIDFLVLKGNHDEYEFEKSECPPNLKFFANEFVYYNYGNVSISGLNLNKYYLPNNFDLLSFDANRINILCLHGQASNFFSENIDYCIPLNALKNKNIDYLALGHIHSFESGNVDNRTIFAYSGILEPRGFDECGQKGFIELDINDHISCRFVPFAKRCFEHIKVDISNASSANDIQQLIFSCMQNVSSENLIKVELVGEFDLNLDKDLDYLEKVLNERFYFAKVIDNSTIKVDYERLKLDVSLKGEFVNTVLNSNDLTNEDKTKIITYGIKALTKGEI
ncbi:MAG: metallophosphoesterase [Clostridia bacterium]|nr:metallophosphoesterase [Clostridia bacterium]